MAREVWFRPQAEADLVALYDYIAESAGPATALSYVNRIEAACLSLEDYPERGTKRDDIWPGLRVLGFERRAMIAFRILEGRVEIVTIAYGGRDCESDLKREFDPGE